MLCAPVDLLWNGGIGTYVKSKQESHELVGDKANDVLRVNGEDLRAKVVGEGGNLGMTQLGRIEYALKGGRLNTDAVDNSAGVDCSDHEVNIKIALGKAIENNKISMKSRDALLESMTDEVADLVLRDNVLQTQAITIAQLQGTSLLGTQSRLIHSMEKQGYLDREIEFLPDDEEISRRHAIDLGLVRPELSVIFSYSKLILYQELLQTNLPDDKYYNEDLIRYFPVKLQKKFKKEIENHPLRREIIATSVTNSIVNRIGSTLFYHLQEDTGLKADDIARAYTVVRDVFELRDFWEAIEAPTRSIKVEYQVELFVDIRKLVERTCLWFLRHNKASFEVSKAIHYYGPGIKELSNCLVQILPPVSTKVYENKLSHYLSANVPTALAKKMASLEGMSSAFDIVEVAKKTKLSVKVVGRIYFEVGSELQLGWLRKVLNNMVCHSYWEKTSIGTLVDELFDEQARLTSEVIKSLGNKNIHTNATTAWLEENQKYIERYLSFMDDLKAQDEPELSMIIVAIRKIKEICS